MKCFLSRELVLLILLILSFKSYSYNAQDSDSLKNLILKSSDRNEKVTLLNQLGESYKGIDYKQAIKIASEALSIAKKDLSNENIVDSYRLLGYCYYKVGDYNKALENYFGATRFFKDSFDKNKLIKTYYTIALIYRVIEDTKLSFRYNNLAYKLLKGMSTPDPLLIIDCFNNYAYLYGSLGEYDTQINFLNKVVKLRKRVNQINQLRNDYSKLGYAYWKFKLYDSALISYNRFLGLSISANDSLDIATAYVNVGTTYYSLGDYSKAINYYTTSLKLNQNAVKGLTYLELVDAYIKLGNKDKVEQYFQLAQEDKSINVKALLDGCTGIYNYYKGIDDKDKVIYYSDIRNDLNESIKSKAETEIVITTKANFEKIKENNELLKENLKEKTENSELQSKYNNVLIGFIIVLVFCFTLAFILARKSYIKREEKKIQDINDEAKQTLDDLERDLGITEEMKKLKEPKSYL